MNLDTLRSQGPAGLSTYLSTFGAHAAPALDRLCAQKDAHTSLLYWFTSLPLAIAEAQRSGRPILSLRMLGRLDETLSCANSRFFRKLLYADADVASMLREGWVLHWQTVREIPRVTVDFGNGRSIQRTITGNAGHLVLDARGRMVDALPGLFSAQAFAAALNEVHPVALRLGTLEDTARPARLEAWHRALREQTRARWASTVNEPHSADLLARSTATTWRTLGRAPRAEEAGALATSKLRLELPMLRALRPLDPELEEDTGRNGYSLRGQVHDAFVEGHAPLEPDAFTAWLYETVFLMPSDDPWLGLAPHDPSL